MQIDFSSSKSFINYGFDSLLSLFVCPLKWSFPLRFFRNQNANLQSSPLPLYFGNGGASTLDHSNEFCMPLSLVNYRVHGLTS